MSPSEASTAAIQSELVENRNMPPGRLHPLSATRLSSWLTVLLRYGGHVPRNQWGRVSLVTLYSLLGTPVRYYETLRHRRQVESLEMQPPVFILGHWRSGTTNFQNHLLQDPQWGYISLLQCLLSPSFMTLRGVLRQPIQNRLPETRAMDSIPIGLDAPMSEDFAMACLSEFTHYHRYFFPKSNSDILRRTVLFDGVCDQGIARWQRTYDNLLRKATLAMGGRRLILKNPPNTGRIRQLVKYYPDAKFIHVYRNPYDVFASTRQLMQRFLMLFSFQNVDVARMEENVLEDYAMIMRRFFDDEPLIPFENYISIRHEDLVADGVGTMQRVYKKLGLSDFENVRSQMSSYVESISDYQTNTYELGDELLDRIRHHCGFAIDRWGYRPPGR